MACQIGEVLLLALAVFYCCAAGTSGVNAEGAERHGKFFAPVVTQTVTSLTFSTTVVPTTVFATCFTSFANITACAARRRRGLHFNEEPIFQQILPNGVILPTQVQVIEATSTPDVQPKSLHANIAALESSNPETTNFEQVQAVQAELGRFVANTVSTTTVITLPTYSISTATGKETATIFIANCKPAGAKLTPAC